jgi:hypothetical protein
MDLKEYNAHLALNAADSIHHLFKISSSSPKLAYDEFIEISGGLNTYAHNVFSDPHVRGVFLSRFAEHARNEGYI